MQVIEVLYSLHTDVTMGYNNTIDMFTLKKVLSAFILPPGVFVAILLLSGIWFLYRRNRIAGIINCILGTLLWLSSILPVSDIMLRGLESGLGIPEDIRGDVIVLLAGGVYDDVPDMSGLGAPSEDTLARIITAVRLQKKLGVPVIISGGAVFEGKSTEASVIKRFLVDLGVPEGMILVEDKSRDTIENAKYTAQICKAIGCKEPLLVTSAYHIKRSLISFEKTGMKVTPFPAQFKTSKTRRYLWYDFLPSAKHLKNTYIALHEYVGLVFYRFAY